jgi:hypothetical protein
MNQSHLQQQQQQSHQALPITSVNRSHNLATNGSSQLAATNAAPAVGIGIAASSVNNSSNSNNVAIGIGNKLRPVNVNFCHQCMRPLSLQSLSGTINSPNGNLIVVSKLYFYLNASNSFLIHLEYYQKEKKK